MLKAEETDLDLDGDMNIRKATPWTPYRLADFEVRLRIDMLLQSFGSNRRMVRDGNDGHVLPLLQFVRRGYSGACHSFTWQSLPSASFVNWSAATLATS